LSFIPVPEQLKIEEIKDTIDRSGAKGYLISGRDAMRRKLTQLEPLKINSSDYDLVVIGTPVWGWNMSVPIRTYITEQKNNFKKVAFFALWADRETKELF
jgi:hypothetical protein